MKILNIETRYTIEHDTWGDYAELTVLRDRLRCGGEYASVELVPLGGQMSTIVCTHDLTEYGKSRKIATVKRLLMEALQELDMDNMPLRAAIRDLLEQDVFL